MDPLLSSIINLLFPKKCLNCSKSGTYFCKNCILEIKQSDLVCPFCERLSLGGVVHPVCKRKYGLDGLWFLGIYENPLRKAIQKLKYKWITELAETLVDVTIEYWVKNPPIFLDQIKKDRGENWAIVPVPLHWSRKNWRGFNQAELIAKLFSQKLGLKYADTLTRVRNTKPQVGKDAYLRKQNIKNAFSLNTYYLIHNTNVLLVDDVWTTGSTLKECCFVLKRGSAKSVWALTLAR